MTLSVERYHVFAILSFPDDNLFFFKAVTIERMARVSGFPHDVISNIDNVVKRPLTDFGEAVLQPFRRRRKCDVCELDSKDSPAECIRVFNPHIEFRKLGNVRKRRLKRQQFGGKSEFRKYRRSLACDAVDREAVYSVGCNFDVINNVVTDRFSSFDGWTTER